MRKVAHNLTEFVDVLEMVKDFVKVKGYPVEIRANKASSKTMEQLGGMFAVWIKEISEHTGEGERAVHARLKDQFLARIYISNPIGPDQQMWVELLYQYQVSGNMEKMEEHSKRISLAWARVHQMSDYMTAIFEDCTANGIFLSPLEKDR